MQEKNIEQVEHVARLAKLALTEEEKKKFTQQLQDIWSDIEKIDALDEEGHILIAPTENHDLYHEDEIKESLEMKEILKNANKTSGDYISVPKVLHDELFES